MTPGASVQATTKHKLRRKCRLDNLVFGADGRVAAVLDWELSTLGHPLADLAYSAMPYHLPTGTPALPSLPDPLPPGTLLLQIISYGWGGQTWRISFFTCSA